MPRGYREASIEYFTRVCQSFIIAGGVRINCSSLLLLSLCWKLPCRVALGPVRGVVALSSVGRFSCRFGMFAVVRFRHAEVVVTEDPMLDSAASVMRFLRRGALYLLMGVGALVCALSLVASGSFFFPRQVRSLCASLRCLSP
eukprot:6211189-Pleurochrysis_carterae.AAC.2